MILNCVGIIANYITTHPRRSISRPTVCRNHSGKWCRITFQTFIPVSNTGSNKLKIISQPAPSPKQPNMCLTKYIKLVKASLQWRTRSKRVLKMEVRIRMEREIHKKVGILKWMNRIMTQPINKIINDHRDLNKNNK